MASKVFKVKTVCIFADPPIDTIKRSFVGKIAKHFEDTVTARNIKKFDGLIVLNKKSIEKYAPRAKYILIDGGFDLDDVTMKKPGGQWLNLKDNDVVEIVFSGALNEYNGIKNLIDAVKYIESKRFCLKIYGFGPLEEYIKAASERDNRIKFFGNIPNIEMLVVQQEAGILINPRPVNDAISLYTFPSKMIEYLLSGTPVISTALNGLTQDYLNNVFIIKNEDPQGIAEAIDYVLNQDKDYLIKKAKNAQRFVVSNKNWDIHCAQIKKFIEVI
jgi:glycosyltransferase involved in cell wall biosynthesis